MSLPAEQNDECALDAFVRGGSESAFALIVSRFADMVFGTALRKSRSKELAEEVTQNVFALLARKASDLRSAKALGVWLHRATIMETRNLTRRELNHRRKMERYSKELAAESEDPLWISTEPHLDDAIDRLPETDRRMIVLRFFEGLSFKEIGAKLGKSEDACQKRTSRALEKLGRQLKRTGIVVPATVIATGLAAQVGKAAAPAALKATLAKSALVNATVTSSTSSLVQIMTYTNWKIAAAVAIAAAIPLTLQWTQNQSLASRLETAQSQIEPAVTTGTPTEQREPTLSNAPAHKETSDVWRSIRQLKKFLAQSEAAPHRRTTLAQLVAHIRTLPVEAMNEAYDVLSTSPLFASHSPQVLDLVIAFFTRWGASDPEAAVEAAFARSVERESAIGAAFSGWVRVDPDAALAALGEARSRLTQSSWEMRTEAVIRALALQDPEEAANKVADLDISSHQKYNLVSAVAGYWADADPDAALRWVETLPNGKPRTGAFISAVLKLANDDPKRAAELTHAMPKGRDQIRLFVGVQEKWWAADPEGSVAWYRARGLRERPPPADQPAVIQSFPIEKK